MKTRIIIILVLFLIVSNELYSQMQSPVGKWVLAEHLVYEKSDSMAGYWNPKNVLNNKFEAFIIFDSCGNFYQQIDDSIIDGRWKLTRNNRKLKVKICSGGSFSQTNKSPLDFNKPLYLIESYKELYDNKEDSSWGGDSKYIRVIPESQKIDSNLLLGNWKITHIQKNKNKKEFTSSWYYKFYRDSINQSESIKGTWELYNSELITDEVIIKEKWDPYDAKSYYIEQFENNRFVFIGINNRKIEMIFLERIE